MYSIEYNKKTTTMTRMEKNDIYDEMCHVLTDYEEDQAGADDLYSMLVKIQNNWEELSGVDD